MHAAAPAPDKNQEPAMNAFFPAFHAVSRALTLVTMIAANVAFLVVAFGGVLY